MMMNPLNALNVKQKLLLLIAVFSIGLIGVGVVGFYSLQQVNQNMNSLYTNELTGIDLAHSNKFITGRIESNMASLMATTNITEKKTFYNDINQKVNDFDENLDKYEKLSLNSEETNNLDELRKALPAYRAARKETIELSMQNKNAEANLLYKTKVAPLSREFVHKMEVMTDLAKKAADQMNQTAQASFTTTISIFSGIIVISILAGLTLGFIIVTQISTRLNDAVHFLAKIADGDFSQDVPQHSLLDHSEFGTLSKAVDKMNKSNRNLIQQLTTTSANLADSSQGLSASAEQSAQASNQVAQSITTVALGANKQLELANITSTVVNEMTKGIQQVTNNTMIVAESAQKTSLTADEGGKAIQTAVHQMQVIEEKTHHTATVVSELEEKSKQIGKIVEVISNIAGQTNLLALNAAIEAARAGDAGRGFSVVAEEVRKLAEQSSQSTKEIIDLITEIQAKTNNAVTFMTDSKKEVNAGTAVVNIAGQSFTGIVQMVQQISEQIHEISAASEQLASGSQSVIDSAEKIAQESKRSAEQTQTISAATEEQSASMEEIAASSQKLNSMALDLQTTIHNFKV
ncbi:methyl-accepting chemotaxis protein [Propionispira raffinosivorans]|uniref:methyl-accepting chemotaxis protein n=1 Tax=Propionispira raffinosivorans TaxID=86959 RepID=UPI002ADE253F|nr:methyl-accepting chemotaxis protein [Propionispira raffinosivorans]